MIYSTQHIIYETVFIKVNFYNNNVYIQHKNLSREINFWSNYLVNYVLGAQFYNYSPSS